MLEVKFPLQKQINEDTWIRFEKPATDGGRVDGISLHFGCIYILKGKNGSGKTTLLNLISALTDCPAQFVQRDSDIVFMATDSSIHPLNKAALRESYFSYVFQDPHIINTYSVEENLRLVNSLFDPARDIPALNQQIAQDPRISSESGKYLQEKLDKFYIERRLSPYALSGGEKQLLAFIRAMIKPGRIVVADEPWASMDEIAKHFVEEQLARYTQGQDVFAPIRSRQNQAAGPNTVLVITHDTHRLAAEEKGSWEIPTTYRTAGDAWNRSLSLECHAVCG
ncbi:MAG: ATP-binding cassette domain-containing protein [Candidatus Latescibacteria bacterium]|nr:ATP-binding cassette domain-containing protein [Candidatus Latescibacterota bacterium]